MSDVGEKPSRKLTRRNVIIGTGLTAGGIIVGAEIGPHIAAKNFPTFPDSAPERPVVWNERTKRRMDTIVSQFAQSPGFIRTNRSDLSESEYRKNRELFLQFMMRYAPDVQILMTDTQTTPDEARLLALVKPPARANYGNHNGEKIIMIPHTDKIIDDFVAELAHHVNADHEFRRGLRGFADHRRALLGAGSVYEQHFALEFQAHSVSEPVLLAALRYLGQAGVHVPLYPMLKEVFAKYPEIVAGKSSYETVPVTGRAVHGVIEYACSFIPFADGATLQSTLQLGLDKVQMMRAFIDAMPYENAKKNGLLHFALDYGMLFSEDGEIKNMIERKARGQTLH